MVNIVIKSEEANAAATALALAVKGNHVCLLAPTLAPGKHSFSYIGEQQTATLFSINQLDELSPTVALVYAEGEDIRAGITKVLDVTVPDLLVIIGGGVTAVTEATAIAKKIGFDVSKILLVGAFLFGGNTSTVRSEKQGVMAGFLAQGTRTSVIKLAEGTFPQITIGDAYAVALSSVNALFHLPPMILNAMSVERGEDIRFYVEGFGDSVCRLLLELDADRLRLGHALGLSLLPIEVVSDIYGGTLATEGKTLRQKVNEPLSTQAIKMPSSFQHRFLAHELRSFFAPMAEMARALNVQTPTIDSVVRIGEILLNADLRLDARVAALKFVSQCNAELSPLA